MVLPCKPCPEQLDLQIDTFKLPAEAQPLKGYDYPARLLNSDVLTLRASSSIMDASGQSSGLTAQLPSWVPGIQAVCTQQLDSNFADSNAKGLTIAVLYGGRSGEHEVSLLSAFSVLTHLDKTRYTILPIGIDKQGHYYLNSMEEVFDQDHALLKVRTSQSISLSCLPLEKIDLIFPMMHGPLYEDGCLQGLLKLHDKPFVGADILASALTMDKDFSKRLALSQGIPCLPYLVMTRFLFEKDFPALKKTIETRLTYPLFVKPANLGSSVGVSKVDTSQTLYSAIQHALQYDEKVMVEQGIDAREIEIGVIENLNDPHTPHVSICGEIITHDKYPFYTYQAKYQDPESLNLVLPASISVEQENSIKAIAKSAFVSLGCEGYARIDFLVDKQTHRVYFNEINTIPGFTTMSMFPILWEKTGLSYPNLLNTLIYLAQARQKRQQAISRYRI